MTKNERLYDIGMTLTKIACDLSQSVNDVGIQDYYNRISVIGKLAVIDVMVKDAELVGRQNVYANHICLLSGCVKQQEDICLQNGCAENVNQFIEQINAVYDIMSYEYQVLVKSDVIDFAKAALEDN